MNVGSLFSGIGGVELGFSREGFDPAWFAEVEPYGASILRERWPGHANLGDVRLVRWEDVDQVDVLTGGFPCQDISTAGNRRGITGARSGLWKEYLRAIRMVRPKYAVMENVAALTHRGLDTVLGDLAEGGLNAEWDCLPAGAFGANHRRDRIFIVAYPESQRGRQDSATQAGRDSFRPRGPPLADTEHSGRRDESQHEQCTPGQDEWREGTLSAHAGDRRHAVRDFRERCCESHWSTEPGVGRVVDGIPAGMDARIWEERIRALGNAVVPQVAQFVASRIKAREQAIRS